MPITLVCEHLYDTHTHAAQWMFALLASNCSRMIFSMCTIARANTHRHIDHFLLTYVCVKLSYAFVCVWLHSTHPHTPNTLHYHSTPLSMFDHVCVWVWWCVGCECNDVWVWVNVDDNDNVHVWNYMYVYVVLSMTMYEFVMMVWVSDYDLLCCHAHTTHFHLHNDSYLIEWHHFIDTALYTAVMLYVHEFVCTHNIVVHEL